MDNKKIFIGNISYSTDFQVLLQKFGEFGDITDSYKPEGKGFAFVTYATEESAQKAIEAMNDVEFDGRQLIVNIARPKGEGGGNAGGPRRFGNDRRGGGGFRSGGGSGGFRPRRDAGGFGGGSRRRYDD